MDHQCIEIGDLITHSCPARPSNETNVYCHANIHKAVRYGFTDLYEFCLE